MASLTVANNPQVPPVNNSNLQILFQNAEKSSLQESVALYTEFILSPSKDATITKDKETAIIRTGQLLKDDAVKLDQFIRQLESVWMVFPRAKAAKLIKSLLDCFETTGHDALLVQIRLISNLIAWCERDKRAFLKQSLESRLGHLYLKARMYTEAIDLINGMLRELKRMDDKLALVEVHLLECKVYFSLRNLAKAKAALIAARSAANAIYCPPLIQASLDLQSGLVHADDGDFKTAYSYFIEALDAYSTAGDVLGILPLKYMVLCKIMLNQVDDVDALIGGKLAQNYSVGKDVEAMKAVGMAYKNRSLGNFKMALQSFPEQLEGDRVVQVHLQSLYDSLLQQNILRIVEPYSRVTIDHIAKSIGLSNALIEQKLCQMILDKVLNGILDQNENCLVVLEDPVYDRAYEVAIDSLKQLDTVVEALYQKAGRL